MSVEDENQKVFQGTPSEDVRLENLGYEQGMLCLNMRGALCCETNQRRAQTLFRFGRDDWI